MMTIHKNVKPGQIWRSNDPRRLRGVRVVAVAGHLNTDEPHATVICENIVSGKQTRIRRNQFATGVRGWSLEKDVPSNFTCTGTLVGLNAFAEPNE